MVVHRGIFLLLLLFAWKSEACVYTDTTDATRRTHLTSASDCLFFTMAVTDATPGRKIAAKMDSGYLGPTGMCRVYSGVSSDSGNLIGVFLSDGSNNGIISQPNNATDAHLFLSCFQDVPQAITFSFHAVDTVSNVEEIANIQFLPNSNFTYQPNTLYEWKMIGIADDAIMHFRITSALHANDILVGYSDNNLLPLETNVSHEITLFSGASINVQLLASDSADPANNYFQYETVFNCFSRIHFLTSWNLYFASNCSSNQRLVEMNETKSYVISFPPRDAPGLKCDVYEGNTTDSLLGTLESDPYSIKTVTGTSADIFIHCSTPQHYTGVFQISFSDYNPISCGYDLTLDFNENHLLALPTRNDGFLSSFFCEWHVQTPFYLNSAQLQTSNVLLSGQSFLQITDMYMIPSVMFSYQNIGSYAKTLESKTATLIRFLVGTNAPNLPLVDISISAVCTKFCYTSHEATEHEIMLEWSDPGDVPVSTIASQPSGAFWYTDTFDFCLAQLPTNTWQNVTVTALALINGMFKEKLATKPGKMDTPFLISISAGTATIGWPQYTEGNVLINTYYVNWDGQTITSTGLSAVITSLLPNSIQTVTVQAVNSAGAGRESDPLTVTTEPTAFLNIRSMACPDTTSIVVEYNDVINDGGVRSLVYGEICWCYDLDDIHSENITGLTHTITGLLPGRRVVVFTKAIYDDGFVARSPNTVVQPVPSAPSSAPTLVAVEMREITIAWEPYNEPGDIVPDEYVFTWSQGVVFFSGTVLTQNTSFTFTLTNLDPNRDYTIEYQVKTEDCVSPSSPILTVRTLPGPAHSLRTIINGETEIVIGWSRPEGGTVREIVGYIAQVTIGSRQENVSVGATTFSARFMGFVPNTAYPFTVTTIFDDGYRSKSDDFIAATKPYRPDSVVTTSTETSMTVYFSHNNTGNLPVRFLYSISSSSIINKTEEFSFQFSNLIPNSLISFSMLAENDFGTSAVFSDSGATLPPAPGSITAVPNSNEIDLTWALPQHGSYLTHDFEIFFDAIAAPIGVRSFFASETFTVITFLESNTYYWIQVAARWSDGSVTHSENTTVLTFAGSFSGPSLLDTTQNSLIIQWDGQPGDEAITFTLTVNGTEEFSDSNQVQALISGLAPNTFVPIFVTACNVAGCYDSATVHYATDPGPPIFIALTDRTSSSLTISWNPPTGDAYAPNGYRILYATETVTVSSSQLSLGLTGLSAGTEYPIAIIATFVGPPETAVSENGCTLPGAPINLMQTDASNDSVTMQWGDPPSCSNIEFFGVNDQSANFSPYTLTNLSPNTEVNIIVRAVTDDGVGDSARVMMATLPDALSVSLSGVNLNAFDIIMTLGGPALGPYNFQHYIISGAGEFTTSDHMFGVAGLEPTSVYNIKVEAVYDGLDSKSTDTVEVHTNPAPPRNLNYLIISPTTVNVTWEKPEGGNDIFEYLIMWGYGPHESNRTDQLEYQITNMVPNTQRSIFVTTVNNEQTSSSPAETQILTDALPADYIAVICTTDFIMVSFDYPDNQDTFRATINHYRVCDGTNPCVNITTSSLNFTMLDAATELNISLTTIYNLGAGETVMFEANSDVRVSTKPEAPFNIDVTESMGYGVALVQWEAPLGGDAITGYVVNLTTATSSREVTVLDPLALSVNVTGLESNTLYSILVAATTDCGQGEFSLEFSYLTVQRPVIEMAQTMATATSTQIMITDPMQDGNYRMFTFYRVFVDGSFVTTTSNGVADLNNLVSNTKYEVTVHSVFGDATFVFGDSIVDSAGSLFIHTIPSTPAAPILSSATSDSIVADWTKPTGGNAITGYEVQCATEPTFMAPHSFNTTSLSATVSNLTSNTEYYCRVIARNQQGSGNPSLSVTISTVPASPVLQFVDSTANSITVSVSVDQGGGADQFVEIEAEYNGDIYTATRSTPTITVGGLQSARRFEVKARAVFQSVTTQSVTQPMYTVSNSVNVSTLTSTQTSITITWIAPTNVGTELDGYEVQLSDSSTGPYLNVGNVLSTTVTDLKENTHYIVYVFAYNSGGRSSIGSIMDIWTDPFDPVIEWAGSTADTISVSYTWDDNEGFEGSVAISQELHVTAEGGATLPSVMGPASTNPMVITGLTPSTWYHIQQTLSLENSGGSLEVTSNSITAVTAPNPPQNLQVIEETETSIRISWDPPSGSDNSSYSISFFALTQVDAGNDGRQLEVLTTSYLVTGLATNTQFGISVQAKNAGGTSDPVTEVATTLPIASGQASTLSASATSLEIEWSSPPNHARTPTYTVEVYDAYGNQLFERSVVPSPYDIYSLTPSTVYHVVIRTEFSDNIIRFSDASRHLTVPDQMPTMSQDFVFSESITVSYVPTNGGFPCCEITQYDILVNSSNGNQSLITYPPDTSFTFSTTPNTAYQVSVRARNSEGPGEYSPELEIYTKPGLVQTATQISATVDSISFEWEPLVEGDFAITDYLVSMHPFSSGDGRNYVFGKTNATYTMLEANRRYAVTVQPSGVGGLLGVKNQASFMYTAPTAPPAPVVSTAFPPSTSMISIKWSCAEFRGCLPITQYRIEWVQIGGNQSDNGSHIMSTDHDLCGFGYDIAGLQINTFYSIRIAAGNDYFFGPLSDPVEICTNPAVPDPPSVQFHHQQQAIIVEWEPPIVGGGVEITMYKIAWSSAADSGHKHVTVTNSNHTAAITGLLPVTTYEVTVQAINDHGIGSASTSGTVTTGSGIICTETPTIKLTAEDVARMDAVAGDQIVVSSRKIKHQPAANQLMSRCKIPAPAGSGAEFHFNLTDCEPLVGFAVDKFDGVNNSSLLFTYTVQLARFSVVSNMVQRFDPTVSFEFQCVFNRSLSVISDNVHPYIFKDLVVMDPNHGQFDLTLDLFTSDHYNTSLVGSPPTVEVLAFVFAQLSLGVETNSFILQAQYCWATPSSSPQDLVSYPIIVDGCPAQNAYDEPGTILVTKNYQPNTAQFQFKAFVWANIPDENQKMFVHCNTMVCDPRNEDGCTDLDCGVSRKRRNVPKYENSQRVTYGPIMLSHKGELLCAEANGGCEDLCMVENQFIKCMCKSGRKLNIDGRTCSAKYYRAAGNQEIPQSVYIVLLAVLVLAVVGLIIHKKPL